MKKINQIPFTFGLVGTFLLVILFFTDSISTVNLISNGIACLSLLAAGTAIILHEKPSGIINYAGIFSAWTGFVIFFAAAYRFIELKSIWKIGFFLLALALIGGITHSLFVNRQKTIKWILAVSGFFFAIFLIGILFSLESHFIFSSGYILLIIFSIVSIVGTFVKSKSQP